MIRLVAFVLLVAGVATLVLWWGRRARLGVAARRLLLVVGSLMVVAGGVGAAISVWAQNSTDSSQVARAIAWGESGYIDQDRFPVRAMSASPDPVKFSEAAASPVADFVPSGGGGTLEEVLSASDTTAFIVIHGDELLYERYFNGSTSDDVQASFSLSKSFISSLVGIAIDEGLIADLDVAVTEYIPELRERDERFDAITIRHLMTMSSGLSFDDGNLPWDDPANTYYGTDLRSAVVSIPQIEGPPGAAFRYNDWNAVLLGLVLERATGMPVAQYMQARLWQPMGAEYAGSWSLDSEQHGFEKMFLGVNGRAIDFAKLGWLYLHQGRNGAAQVVPAEFVAAATRNDTTTDPAADYQYLWWVDVERDSYYALGDHGQVIYVDPVAELVVVRQGRNHDVDWVEMIGELSVWLTPQLQGPVADDG